MDNLIIAIALICQIHTQGSFTPHTAQEIQALQRKCVADVLKCYYVTKGKPIQECI